MGAFLIHRLPNIPTRAGLAGGLHDLFLLAALVAVVAVVVSFFLREVRLTQHSQPVWVEEAETVA